MGIPSPATLLSYNWFPGMNGNGGGALIGPLEPQISEPPQPTDIVEYNFVTDVNGWTNAARFRVANGVYLGPIILPKTWPNPCYLVRARSVIQDGSGEIYVFLDRGSRYFNTGKPRGSESGTLCDIITLHHAFFSGPFTEKWDFPPVLFDRTADKLVVNLVPVDNVSWINIEFSCLIPA